MTGVYEGELSVSAKGLFLGVMSGVAYAMYSIFSRFAINRGYASETISFYTFVFAGLGSLPLVDFAHLAGIMNYNVAFYELCMGVICCAAPYTALRRKRRSKDLPPPRLCFRLRRSRVRRIR